MAQERRMAQVCDARLEPRLLPACAGGKWVRKAARGHRSSVSASTRPRGQAGRRWREAKSIILTWHGEAAGADCCCSCWVQCCRGKRALPSASRSWGRMQLQI